MYIVTVQNKAHLWARAFGPFDTYLEAQKFLFERQKVDNNYYRNGIFEVESPDNV